MQDRDDRIGPGYFEGGNSCELAFPVSETRFHLVNQGQEKNCQSIGLFDSKLEESGQPSGDIWPTTLGLLLQLRRQWRCGGEPPL